MHLYSSLLQTQAERSEAKIGLQILSEAHQTVSSSGMNGNNNTDRQHHNHSADLTDKWLIGDLPNRCNTYIKIEVSK